jgi:hypothetical protein
MKESTLLLLLFDGQNPYTSLAKGRMLSQISQYSPSLEKAIFDNAPIRRLKAKKAYSYLPDTYEFPDICDFLFYFVPPHPKKKYIYIYIYI